MSTQQSERASAVLFDLDGVLVRTEELKAEAHVAATRCLGGAVPASFYSRFLGMPHSAVRDAFLMEAGIRGNVDRYTEIYRGAYAELLANRLEAVPGAVELVRTLAARGFRLAVVTSTNSATTDFILRNIGLADCFQARISADDVREAKPAPDAYLLALRILGVSSRTAVVVEDSEAGVEAACRAGIPAIALRHSWNTGHNFAKAVAEIKSLRDPGPVLAAIAQALQAPAGEAGHEERIIP
jgi:HAD superfamily hydrolase (TIGR01509 family)